MVEKGIKHGRKIGDLEIAIVEKGPAGRRSYFVGWRDGPDRDPRANARFLAQGCPVDSVVTEDAFWYLTERKIDQLADHSAAAQK